jgi:hypothetical protein
LLLDFWKKSVVIDYYLEIQNVVNSALAELKAEQQQGRLPNSPLMQNNFLVRWVSKSLKNQQFERCVIADLTRWQQEGRSKGNHSHLLQEFKRIAAFYAHFFAPNNDNRITDQRIEAFLDVMEKEQWEVTTAEPIVGQGKMQIFTEGQSSLALCANQCESCFDGPVLIRPMSWFVRGNHAQFVQRAFELGFMLHKRTDYKSNVKYHGEYIIYPENHGIQLAEIPLHYMAD